MTALGFTHLPLVPVRKEPDERAEMVTQLLFGDWIRIRHTQGSWVEIETVEDAYPGWIDSKMFLPWDKPLPEGGRLYVNETYLPARVTEGTSRTWTNRLSLGATFPEEWLNGKHSGLALAEIGNVKISVPIHGLKQAIPAIGKELAELSRVFLGAPYLWGGRSVWGMDCSGFTQIVFRLCGQSIPRDASQQVTIGETVSYQDRQAGDLAFFSGQEGRPKHVGIVLAGNKIIHASGRVREDELTENGILNVENETLTHELFTIKRYL